MLSKLRVLLVGLVALVWCLGLGVSTASAAPATISGTVVDDTGQPVDTCVMAYPVGEYLPAGSACTNWSNGAYTISGLTEGVSYQLSLSGGQWYASTWAPNAPSKFTAQKYTAPAVVDVTMPRAAEAKGTLTDAAGAPAAFVHVSLTNVDSGSSSTTYTSSTGSWQLLVPPGRYTVEFRTYPTPQWAHGQPARRPPPSSRWRPCRAPSWTRRCCRSPRSPAR